MSNSILFSYDLEFHSNLPKWQCGKWIFHKDLEWEGNKLNQIVRVSKLSKLSKVSSWQWKRSD